MIITGDCLEELRQFDAASVDSVVTDPPYGLGDTSPSNVEACLRAWLVGDEHEASAPGFMGRAWDSWVPGPNVWRECLRVLKPGGHLLAFAGSRTVDLMGVALRLAGFEVRDTLQWLYGSGFPKSLDVSKAIDAAAGAEREVVGTYTARGFADVSPTDDGRNQWAAGAVSDKAGTRTAPATDDARTWSGWGTALKPAAEPILMCRKPLAGTVAANVLDHGVGGVNVDGCRVQTADELVRPPADNQQSVFEGGPLGRGVQVEPPGRWPANVILTHALGCAGDRNGGGCVDGCAVGELGEQSGASTPSDAERRNSADAQARTVAMRAGSPGGWVTRGHDDAGTAARFFPTFRYQAKAARGEREAGVTGERRRQAGQCQRVNHHPTVKPVDVMRWLVRLVTPPGGLVLDPFCGSGTTGCAAVLEGFRFVGIEREAEYAAIARQRIAWWSEHGDKAVAAHAAKVAREAEDDKTGQMGLW